MAYKCVDGLFSKSRGVYFYKNDNVWRDEFGVLYGGYSGPNIDIITYLENGSAT
jgi:hypothetical protein